MDNGERKPQVIRMLDHQAPRGSMSAKAIKDEIIAGVAAGSLAMGQKVYEQVMENVVRLLGEMEARHEAQIAQLRADAGL